MEKTRTLTAEPALTAPDHSLPTDTLLQDGKFIIDQPIGAGGFGITYLAHDAGLERTVVIKECFADGFCRREGSQVVVDAPNFAKPFQQTVGMFVREARSIAMLRHPNIVGVHQVFQENGTAYMVLDLIEGRDLADVIELPEKKPTPDEIHGILVKLLDAVAVVHESDLLHRDISPENILLDKWGSPTLIDFGAVREDASRRTGTGKSLLFVKDGYSPHEFYKAGAMQAQSSDLYGLAATMYHLISGEAPADAVSRAGAIAAGEADPCAPLSGRFDGFDAVILETIDQAMQIKAGDRIQTARAWLERIEAEEEKSRVVKMPLAVPFEELTNIVSETDKAFDGFDDLPKVLGPAQAHAKDAYKPRWRAEFNYETAKKARRLRGQSHIANKAARLAKKAAQEEQARQMLEAMEEQSARVRQRRSIFEGFFTDSLIFQWMNARRT